MTLHHDMRVCTGPAETAHASQRRSAGYEGPLRCRRSDTQGKLPPIDRWRRIVKIQVLRDDAPIHRQQYLHHPGNARRRFQMSEVRLHGTYEQRSLSRTTVAVCGCHCPQLDRVAHRRSRAMRFHIVHL